MSKGETVAVLGLGRMGHGIASSLLRSGFDVRVYNRTVARCAPLAERGATACATPAEAAAGATAVISSLLNDDAVRDVLLRRDGLLAGLDANTVHIATTTASPALTEWMVAEHDARDQSVLIAPVAGRPDAASAGELLSIVAGPLDTFKRVQTVVEGYSRASIYAGPEPTSANAMKLAFNFFVVGMIELFGETFAFADAWGLEAETVRRSLSGILGNPALSEYLDRISRRDFDDAGFELTTGLKDVELMLSAGTRVRVPLPIANVARDHLLKALAEGRAEQDWSALTEAARVHRDGNHDGDAEGRHHA